MLLAEFLLAVPPAARGDARGDALVGAGGVHRHRGAEAVAEDGDALRIDMPKLVGGERTRVAFNPSFSR